VEESKMPVMEKKSTSKFARRFEMTGSGMTTLAKARVETPSTESESQKASP
jgi:hypothetical protein